MRQVEYETGRGCNSNSDFIGEKLRTVEGYETVYTESSSGEEGPERTVEANGLAGKSI
jgi:hypothetical protein